MSVRTERYNTPDHPIGNLYVTQCGMTECAAGHQVPPRTYVHCSMTFVLEGMGTYLLNGKTYHIGPGQGFMIFPDTLCSYAADSQSPWKYIYACFYGTGCQNLLYYTGLSPERPDFTFSLSEEMTRDLFSMLRASKDMTLQGYDVTGYFMIIVSRLMRSAMAREKKRFLPKYTLDKAVLFIEDNYMERISVTDIANHLNMNRTNLYRMFVSAFGVSPAEYLLSYRLERAEMMLKNHALSVGDVAVACGFYDQSHFTRSFSRKYQKTPSEYRRTE